MTARKEQVLNVMVLDCSNSPVIVASIIVPDAKAATLKNALRAWSDIVSKSVPGYTPSVVRCNVTCDHICNPVM